jgi:Tol biopolymer transport system component/DNA-binding winged helix-turn-helix (wHTH) protein
VNDVVTYEFGQFRLDLARVALTREGTPIPLEPKAFDVLACLLAHRERVVSKDELLETVWAGTFVTPNVLTRAVAQIRKALGDESQDARYIETIAKRGYRFIAPVTVPDPAGPVVSPPAFVPPAVPEPAPPSARLSPGRRRTLAMLVVAVLVVVVAAGTAYVVGRAARGRSRPQAADVHLRRLTNRVGFNALPALSPDGRAVVYVSDATGGFELYLSNLVDGSPEVPLTSNGGQNIDPAWSPDGQWIAFHSNKSGGIWIVPSTGGTPQQVAEFGGDPAWAPDSSRLVFTSNAGGFVSQSSLWTVRRDGSDRRELTKIGSPPGGHRAPSWSHDGRYIAFISGVGTWVDRVYLLDVSTGAVTRAADVSVSAAPCFGPDDRTLFFGGTTGTGNGRLFRLALDGKGGVLGRPETVVPVDGAFVDGISVAADGTLAFSASTSDANLWAIDLDASGAAGAPTRVTDEATRNTHPSISPLGFIVYDKIPIGAPPTTWVMREDGRDQAPLVAGLSVVGAQWSADGRRVFVMQKQNGTHEFGWVDLQSRRYVSGGLPVKDQLSPRLSPDDRQVAFHRVEPGGGTGVWLSTFDGAERKVASDREAVSYPAWSPDGRWLAVELKRGDSTQIGVVPSTGGPVVQITDERGQHWPDSWAPDNDRIAFAGERDGVWNIYSVSRTSRQVTRLTSFTSSAGYVRYPAWSPSGRRIVFERALRTGHVWTITPQSGQ